MRKQIHQMAYAALLCALIIVSTLWIKFPIPGTEILFTTQVLFVLLCGHLLTPRYCFLAIGVYMGLGLAGVPVFSATQGLAIIATPSFGYLLAFPFVAAAVSFIRIRLTDKKWAGIAASLAGLVILYAIALPYIALLKGLYLSTPISTGTLLSAYCLPFLPLDILKAVLAAWLAKRLIRFIR